MAIQTHCPSCEAVYTLAESQRGKKVRCRKCSDTFIVGESAGSAAKSGKLRKDALQASARPPARTPPPRTKPAVRRDRDRYDDEDREDRDNERVVKKKSGSAMPMILMIGGGILLLFLL